jgi:hypothetical protein
MSSPRRSGAVCVDILKYPALLLAGVTWHSKYARADTGASVQHPAGQFVNTTWHFMFDVAYT